MLLLAHQRRAAALQRVYARRRACLLAALGLYRISGTHNRASPRIKTLHYHTPLSRHLAALPRHDGSSGAVGWNGCRSLFI